MQHPFDYWFTGLGSETTMPTHSGLPRDYLRSLGSSGAIETGLESSDPHEFAVGLLLGVAQRQDNLPPASEMVPDLAQELHERFGLSGKESKEMAMEAYKAVDSYVLGPQFRRN